MLRVAVTGGIGSGKSTVSARLARQGAVVVDSDRLAREVVAVGSPGLAAVVQRFGPSMLTSDGALDRAALAAVVFSDPDARRALEGITHPRVRARFDELAAAAPVDAVVVNDIPLLVALPVAAGFHLVIGVGADAELRVRRLIARGLAEADARARIAAQIDDDTRRPLTDVWLDNDGAADDLADRVDRLWSERVQPFEELLLRGAAAPRDRPEPVAHDPRWTTDAVRLLARVGRAAGDDTVRLDHIGATAVPGLPADDVLELQLTVSDLAAAERVGPALTRAGFVAMPNRDTDTPHPADADPARWRARWHANADPGRAVDLHVRPADGPGWRWALAMRDRLIADDAEREAHLARQRRWAAEHADDPDGAGVDAAREAWWGAAAEPLARWVERTGWRPGPDSRV
ncbi:dephospho-CoA kinase [Nakamurella deserti]|uniref:dephospho-CoA kinase n=1 Tax=Nakamurella deserti TaxID=2164074 RepID=UPI000DBE557F|nr:dephospho-CoA kinase [Nakamurella deserti]